MKCFKGESRIIHRRLKEVSKVVLSSLKGALRLFQGNFKEFKSILSASMMFNDCLKISSSMFWVCFQGCLNHFMDV